MQNLTLQMAPTTTLKKTMDVANNNASADSAGTQTPNVSFQTLLKKQVKNQIPSGGQELAQHKQPQKISNVRNRDESEQKAPVVADYTEFIVAANDKKNIDRSMSEYVELARNPKDMAALQTSGTPKERSVAEDADEKEMLNEATNVSVTAPAAPILAPIVLTPVSMANVPENSVSPVTNTSPQIILTPENAKQKQDEVQDLPVAKVATEQFQLPDAMQPITKRTVNSEPAAAKLVPDSLNEKINDLAIKNMATPLPQHTLAQINTSLPMQQAANANSINFYPGKAGWDQAISQKVVWMVGAGEQTATLTLNPPDLGPLQVVINVNNDKADTTFISDNAEVRQALQDGISNLREKMGESGIQLGQANISSGGQAQQEFHQAMQNRAASTRSDNSVIISQEDKTGSTTTLVRTANGLVDTFA
jgi:flagellar hook-length control protein FliK